MQIITDNVSFAGSHLEMSPSWGKTGPKRLAVSLRKLAGRLFGKKALFSATLESSSLWSYLFLVEFSPRSQFEIFKELLAEEADLPGGIVCLAGSGKGFKGYRNRNWAAVPGNLHLSVLLKPKQPIEHFHVGFTILSANALVQAIDSIEGMQRQATIKWVNDVLLEGAKVGGVLTHTQTQGREVTAAVLGLGLNVQRVPDVSPDSFVPSVTSLQNHCLNPLSGSRGRVLKRVLDCLDTNYHLLINDSYNELLGFYRERSAIIGRRVTVYSDPPQGLPQLLAEGKVLSIGTNLELELEGQKKPLTGGRLVLPDQSQAR